MKGKVISYIPAKKFGFIQGEDGESYFLHITSLLDKDNESKLVKDVEVEFIATETPKGLAAKEVHVPEVFFKKQLVKFFTAKSNQPKYGQVAARHSFTTQFFADANQGRRHIKQLAADSGANAVLNTSSEKMLVKTSDGEQEMHSFSGDFALVTENCPCETVELSAQSDAEVASMVSQFDKQFKRIASSEKQMINKQDRTFNPMLLAGAVVLLGAIFAVMSR